MQPKFNVRSSSTKLQDIDNINKKIEINKR